MYIFGIILDGFSLMAVPQLLKDVFIVSTGCSILLTFVDKEPTTLSL